MTVQTQNLNYQKLITGLTRVASGSDGNFQTEEWDNTTNFDGRILIIIDSKTNTPVAAVKFNPGRTSSGALFNRIKNAILLQPRLTEEEYQEFLAFGNLLARQGFASHSSSKLNWKLQLLDELFRIRCNVSPRSAGVFLFEKITKR